MSLSPCVYRKNTLDIVAYPVSVPFIENRFLYLGPSTGLYRIPKSSRPVLHLFYRCRLQNYISWTEGSRPLQFAVDGVEQVRRLDVKYNTSSAVLPAYSDSYSVLLLDEYLQPEVPCTSVL